MEGRGQDGGGCEKVSGGDNEGGGSNNEGSGGGWRAKINVDHRSAVSEKHPIGWETRAAWVPLPNVVVVDGREGINDPRS
jgi:hypothetical protein